MITYLKKVICGKFLLLFQNYMQIWLELTECGGFLGFGAKRSQNVFAHANTLRCSGAGDYLIQRPARSSRA